MKQTYKTGLLALVMTMGLGTYSCTNTYEEINTNKTKLTDFDASAIGNAYAAAQYRSISAGWQIYQSLFADLQSQYFATVAQNFPSDRNVMVGNWLNGAFNSFYETAIPPLFGVLESTKPGGKNESPTMFAMANIWKVYMFLPRTDYWGPIPYSQVGNGERSVAYDTQEFIYKDFLTLLTESTTTLSTVKGTNIFGNNDQIYGGNVDKWIQFANTMRLRIAMRMSKVEPALAKTNAEAAVAGGVLTSNANDAFFTVNANSYNPMNRTTGWNEYRMSAAMESVLKGYADPRLSKFFAPVAGKPGVFKGLRNGYSQAQLSTPENTPGANSNVADGFLPAVQQSNPYAILYASEAYFLRAEGALKGWNMGGTAKDLYEKGIETSMKQWGIADAAVAAYTSSTTTPVALTDLVKTPALTDIPVKFSADPAKQLEQIITQKWLANYPNGHESWAEYRRTGYPKLYARINSDNPDVPKDAVVRRTPFVLGEYQTNKAATEAAVTKLGGPDNSSTRLWWNK